MPVKTISKVARKAFFKVLSESANISAACEVAGVKRRWAEKMRELDADWANDWEDAIAISNDAIDAEIRRRAMKGVTRIAFGPKGIIIGPEGDPLEITEYSDKLLEFHARAAMPMRYGDLAQTVIPALPADLAPDPKPTPDSEVPELIE